MTNQAWLFGKVPNGYWTGRPHRAAYMRWLGARLGFSKPEDWYALKREHFRRNRGAGLLALAYGDSPLQALQDFMPEKDWKPWLLHSTPQRFWRDAKNRRDYMRWLETQLGIVRPEQWYDVTKEDFIRYCGHGLLANYYGDSVFEAVKEYLPKRRWLPWRFASAPQGFWQKANNRARYLDWLAERLGLRTPEAWYSVTLRQIAKCHGATLTASCGHSMLNILREYMPDYDWKPWLFRRIPANYWQNPENRRRYLLWLGEELGYRLPRDWYQLTGRDVVQTGGGVLWRDIYRGRLLDLLRERYPNYSWNAARLAVSVGRADHGGDGLKIA